MNLVSTYIGINAVCVSSARFVVICSDLSTIAVWILGAKQESNNSCSLLVRVLVSVSIGEGAVDAMAKDNTILASIGHLKDRGLSTKFLRLECLTVHIHE